MKPAKLVTKEFLKTKLAENPTLVIGRALVAIFNNQTAEERAHNTTKFHNGVGFTGTDGRIGAITAKYYLKHKRLEDWQIKNWLKPTGKNQEPRILKYAEQLNRIANAKLSTVCP